jgi:hypothetical protein
VIKAVLGSSNNSRLHTEPRARGSAATGAGPRRRHPQCASDERGGYIRAALAPPASGGARYQGARTPVLATARGTGPPRGENERIASERASDASSQWRLPTKDIGIRSQRRSVRSAGEDADFFVGSPHGLAASEVRFKRPAWGRLLLGISISARGSAAGQAIGQ